MSKKFIKEEILNTTRRLFNQHGYNDVSMRDIADALGISVGNLTYHYPRKEDLVEAVVAEMHAVRAPAPMAPPTTLQELNAQFARLQNSIQENAFYFWHYTQLAQLSPAIHQKQKELLRAQYARLEQGFANLRAAGLFKPEDHPGQTERLVRALQLVCIYWVPQQRLIEPDDPGDLLDCLWTVMMPLLTEAGRKVYEESILKVRMTFE